ncbi:MAG: tetratricopeptide repeat protein [Chloroflexota bacterium]
MEPDQKPDIFQWIDRGIKVLASLSALVSITTSWMDKPEVARTAMVVLAVFVAAFAATHFSRIIFQKSPREQAYHVLLPASVAGRGELVHRYPSAQRRKATIQLILWVLLLLGVAGFNTWQANQPPVTPAHPGEFLILVVPFQGYGSFKPEENYANEICKGLDDVYAHSRTIRIEYIGTAIIKEKEEARELGRKANASLVIWGEADLNSISPRYEITTKESERVTPLLLGSTKSISTTLDAELAEGMVYSVRFTIGQIHYLTGEYEEALQAFDTAIERLEASGVLGLDAKETLDWGLEYPYFYRANTYLFLLYSPEKHQETKGLLPEDFIREAIKNYQLAIKKNPNFAVAYNNLGSVYSLLGYPDAALENYETAIEVAKAEGLTVAYYNKGNVLYRKGDYLNAASNYSHAIDQAEKAGRPLYSLGFLNCAEGHFTLCEYEPSLPRYYLALADCHLSLCDYEQARDEITTALTLLEIDKDKVRALVKRGVTYTRMGQYTRALSDYEHALDIDPEYAYAHYDMAATYALMGKTDEALDALNKAVQLNQELENSVACDPDFDSIRDHPQVSAYPMPETGCEPVGCPPSP